ncbi:MAG: WD40 repeat domain-containing protein, partial [Abitibacteriaceae bacterium]|nr:WD40 repeat domain-containing protein [Abditibacteriaceae bacterium]
MQVQQPNARVQHFLIVWCVLVGCLGTPAVYAIMADTNFAGDGARAMVWQPHSDAIIAQGAEGITVRAVKTLRLQHFLRHERLVSPKADQSASQDEPELIASRQNRLAFEVLGYDGAGRRTAAGVLWRDRLTGQQIAYWRGAHVTADHQSSYFSNHRGRFRVLNLQSGHWFNIVLPLRETLADPHLSDPDFRKLDKEQQGQPHAYLHEPQLFFSADGLHAADQTGDGHIRLWDTTTKRQQAVLIDRRGSYISNPGARGPVLWSPDGTHVATLGEDPEHFDIVYDQGPNDGTVNEHPPVVKVWDAHSGKLLSWHKLDAYDNTPPQLLQWLDNSYVIAGAQDCFEVWKPFGQRGAITRPLKHVKANAPMVLSPNRRWLMSQGQLWQVRDLGRTVSQAAWSATQIHLVAALTPAPPFLKNLAWSWDSRFLATSFSATDKREASIYMWRVAADGLPRLAHATGFFAAMRLAWTQQGRLWASNLYDLTFWDAQHHWQEKTWKPFTDVSHNPPSAGLFATSNEKTFLQLSDGIKREVWRLDQGQRPQLWLHNAKSGSFSEVLSPDGRFYGCADTSDGATELVLYDLYRQGRVLRLGVAPRMRAETNQVGGTAYDVDPVFSGNGRYVAFGGRIFSLPSGRLVSERRSYKDGNALALSFDGRYLLRSGAQQLSIFKSQGPWQQRLCRDVNGVDAAAF